MTNEKFTLTVTKFNSIVRDIFNAEELLHNIKIVGEVFGISLSKSATYFSIKDEESSLPCVCFYGAIADGVKEGDSVVVTGSPNFYAKSGRFNFVVSKIEPYGQGVLYQRFLLLKEKLQNEGLFDESHKKAIPQNIKRIGVVTSKDGAVIQDIKNVSWRRNPAVDIVLYNTKVQGNDAEKEIAQGIDFFSNYDGIDVVVVARGGGSLEDLSAYNTELVARATYNCQKPIVSAVGHETDFTIIDFVADLRAPTPSAAAELLTKDSAQQKTTLKKEVARLERCVESFVADKNLEYQTLKNNVISLVESDLNSCKDKFDKLLNKISTKLNAFLVEADYKLKLKVVNLEKLNPTSILSLGYARIEQNDRPIYTAQGVTFDSDILVNFADGTIVAKPEKKE